MAEKKLGDYASQSSVTTNTRFVILEEVSPGQYVNKKLTEAGLRSYIQSIIDDTPVPDPIGKNGVGITAIGDSITQEGRTGRWGWLAKMCYFSGQLLRDRLEFAVGGTTAEQIEANQLPLVLAMNPKPKACVVAAGSNNLSTAQVTSGIAAVKRMCQTLVDNDIQPILWAPPPRGDLPASESLLTDWRNQIISYQGETGWPFIDAWAYLKNPSSYAITPTSATYDGTHLTAEGCAIVGQQAAIAAASWTIPKDVAIPLATAVGGSLFTNPLFADSNGDGVADQATKPALYNATNTAATSPAVGRVQRFIVPANTTIPSAQTSSLGNVDVSALAGQKIRVFMRFNTSIGANGVTLNGTGQNFSTTMGLYFAKSDWSPANPSNMFLLEKPGLATETGILYSEVTVPSDASWMSLVFATTNANNIVQAYDRWAEVAQLTVNAT